MPRKRPPSKLSVRNAYIIKLWRQRYPAWDIAAHIAVMGEDIGHKMVYKICSGIKRKGLTRDYDLRK